MKTNKISLFVVACILATACTGSKSKVEKSTTTASETPQSARGLKVLSGGDACNRILTLDDKYFELNAKEVAEVRKSPDEMKKIKLMLTEMEKLAKDYPTFSCTMLQGGKKIEYSRNDYVEIIEVLKQSYGT
jgi:hypothetical protein